MAQAARRAGAGNQRHPAQYLALAIGIIYTLIGILGFFVTGFDQFAQATDETLLGFAINPLHNLVHLVIGVLGLAMWSSLGSARSYGWILVIAYGATTVYGFFAAGNPDLNFLNINAADNGLHLVSTLAGLAIALWPAREAATAR